MATVNIPNGLSMCVLSHRDKPGVIDMRPAATTFGDLTFLAQWPGCGVTS